MVEMSSVSVSTSHMFPTMIRPPPTERPAKRARRGSLPSELECRARTGATLAKRRRSSSTTSAMAEPLSEPVATDISERTRDEDDDSAVIVDDPCHGTESTASRAAPQLSSDIIAIILDFVLHDVDFGDNDRWLHHERSKEQWVRAHREWAFLHRKFSLIHRSWTPHVLKSLWSHPRLTSRVAIEKFIYCLNHPYEMWAHGYETPVISERPNLVRFLSYAVGAGRYSSTDYILYSGSWISETAMVMQAQLPRYHGFEAEGWCSTSCQEAPILEEVPIEDWPTHIITRVSLIRSPIQACAISMMMFSAPRLETLELLDVGAHLWVGSALVDLLRTRSKTLRFLALRLNHQPDHPGVLDNIFEICPHVEVLHVHPDLISRHFFAQKLSPRFRTLLLGSLTAPPIVFSGTEALAALWERAAERWPAFTQRPTECAVSNQSPTPQTSFPATQYPGSRQDRLTTVERAHAASEDTVADGFHEVEDWMEQEMRLPGFLPAPLGPKETSRAAAALSG